MTRAHKRILPVFSHLSTRNLFCSFTIVFISLAAIATNIGSFFSRNSQSLSMISGLIIITLIGWISLSFIGKRVFELFESILNKIPILRTIYYEVDQLIETFSKSKSAR